MNRFHLITESFVVSSLCSCCVMAGFLQQCCDGIQFSKIFKSLNGLGVLCRTGPSRLLYEAQCPQPRTALKVAHLLLDLFPGISEALNPGSIHAAI